MNADHDYKIGHDHIVCEDYSLSGVVEENGAYAIVCDGCSASPDVDFGARILALSAKETLAKVARTEATRPDGKNTLTYEEFGSQVLLRAESIFPYFPSLHPQFLDSTLLITWVKQGVMKAYLYGDGAFFHKVDNDIVCFHVSMSTNAPDYLSYGLDKQRRDGYDTLKGVKTVYSCVMTEGTQVLTNEKTETVPPFSPVEITSNVKAGDIIAVCSDGINSFRQANSLPIHWRELVNEFIGYKNFEGVFAKRRFAAFKRKCQKEGMVHSDDISVASIVI